MAGIARWIYDHSPVWGQNVICTAAGHLRNWQRYDRGFEKRVEAFRVAARHVGETAEKEQLEQLRSVLRYCLEKVPYYRRAYDGITPADIRSLEDWSRLPALSKDDVRMAGVSLVASDYDVRKLVVSHSGGSTGMPLRCYHTAEALKQVYASHWAYQRPGVNRWDAYATFQGMELIPAHQHTGPYWRMNRAMRQRLYSIYHLSEATIAGYIEDLDRYRPVYMAGYANSLYLLAKLTEECEIKPVHSPRAVFTTSEQLYPEYRRTIERVFRTRVWDAYSQDETCGSITEYECGHYHYDPAYGHMEFVDLEDLGKGRRLAEIVCTGLLNPAWPLLRYRPGDMVEYTPADRCPGCGRSGPIIHAIRGRTGDVLVTPGGRRFPHISLIVKNLKGVRQVQLVQETVDRVTIRFVPSEDFRGKEDVDFMCACFRGAVDDSIEWSAECLESIPRTRGGKFLSIVNRISGTPRPLELVER